MPKISLGIHREPYSRLKRSILVNTRFEEGDRTSRVMSCSLEKRSVGLDECSTWRQLTWPCRLAARENSAAIKDFNLDGWSILKAFAKAKLKNFDITVGEKLNSTDFVLVRFFVSKLQLCVTKLLIVNTLFQCIMNKTTASHRHLTMPLPYFFGSLRQLETKLLFLKKAWVQIFTVFINCQCDHIYPGA